MQRTNSNNGNINNNNGGTGAHPACASCKHQRKRCGEDCTLAPYFPANRARDFQAVHKVFGVSNVMKLVRSVPKEDQKAVVDSLIWEANCRQADPVLGPYGQYMKIEEQLRLFKSSQSQILSQNLYTNQSVQLTGQGGQIQKQVPGVITCNAGTNVTSGINNSMVHYSGNLNSIQYGSPFHQYYNMQVMKQEKENSLIVPTPQQQQQQLLVNGYNHLPGLYGSMNNKTMDNATTLWDEDQP